jgi:hypothetical protein
LLIGSFSFAQEAGSIKGTVKDAEGNPLPGVTITLTGSKIPTRTFVTAEGGTFRFLTLPLANDYTIKFELQGFKTIIREQQIIAFGRDNIYEITMEQSAIEEEVTVVGQSPVIDTKKTQVGVNITEEMILSLPTSRNAWVMMNLVPGMLLAKEDVGGNESGQQYGYTGHGSGGQDNTWNIDGANVTDMSALGASQAYYNIPSYEEIQVNYGNNDVKSQTGGVQINLVTRRGGNAFSGLFYMEAEDKAWQSENVPEDLKPYYGTPGVDRVYTYGVNFGGPIAKDKAWFYGSYGIQDLNIITLAGRSDKTWLANGYAKLNFQLTSSTRAEIFMQYDNKLKWNRNDYYEATELSAETYWNQDGPGYTFKGELDQSFGNLYLNLKGIYLTNNFYLHPLETSAGLPFTVSYDPVYFVSGAMDDYGTERTNLNLIFTGDYFAENILGGDHEFKFGVDYLESTVTTYDYYEGNVQRYFYGLDAAYPNGQYWEVDIRRDVNINWSYRRYGLFIQDTMTFGRLAVNLGFRYDNETSFIKDQKVPASPFASDLLPALEIAKLDPGASYREYSPRVSLVYDISGTGKDVLKLSLARYGAQSGYSMANFINPMGWGGIGALWQDGVGGPADGVVQNGELYGKDADGNLTSNLNPDTILWAWGVNVYNPTDVAPFNKIDPDYNSPLLDELTASYERELFSDFRASLEFYYKKSHKNIYDIGMNPDGSLNSKDNYYQYSADPVTGYPVYSYYNDFFYTYRTNFTKRFSEYIAGQLVLVKRLSHRWMLDASVTISSWKEKYNGEFINPQNIPYYDGAANNWMNSRWQVKIAGLYQFPYAINFSMVFRAREGYVRSTYANFTDIPNVGTSAVYGSPGGGGVFGDERLPDFYEFDFRLEKVFSISEKMRVTIAADCFNAMNYAHTLAQQNLLTSDIYGRPTNILNPRVFRFGARFEF